MEFYRKEPEISEKNENDFMEVAIDYLIKNLPDPGHSVNHFLTVAKRAVDLCKEKYPEIDSNLVFAAGFLHDFNRPSTSGTGMEEHDDLAVAAFKDIIPKTELRNKENEIERLILDSEWIVLADAQDMSIERSLLYYGAVMMNSSKEKAEKMVEGGFKTIKGIFLNKMERKMEEVKDFDQNEVKLVRKAYQRVVDYIDQSIIKEGNNRNLLVEEIIRFTREAKIKENQCLDEIGVGEEKKEILLKKFGDLESFLDTLK